MAGLTDIDDLIEMFDLIEDWEERYRLIIDMGRGLADMDPALKTDQSKVEGCVSQVWLVVLPDNQEPPHLHFLADSDAHIVRGLIAILISAYDGKTGADIMNFDADALLAKLGLDEHLSPNRRNGLVAMVARIRGEAARLSAATV